jgi:hypothetical protein
LELQEKAAVADHAVVCLQPGEDLRFSILAFA